jgi:hypothetical protein
MAAGSQKEEKDSMQLAEGSKKTAGSQQQDQC